MKVVNIVVDEKTFNMLESGELVLDVRIDEIHKGVRHEVGDMLIYSMRDKEGQIVDERNLAFLVTTKVELQTFVERIGEQIVQNKGQGTSEELIIVTLAQVAKR